MKDTQCTDGHAALCDICIAEAVADQHAKLQAEHNAWEAYRKAKIKTEAEGMNLNSTAMLEENRARRAAWEAHEAVRSGVQ